MCWYDTLGLPVAHAVNVRDRDDGLNSVHCLWLLDVYAKSGHACLEPKDALWCIGYWNMRRVKCSDAANGFDFPPRQGAVERTVAWVGRCRRLAMGREEGLILRACTRPRRPDPPRQPADRKPAR